MIQRHEEQLAQMKNFYEMETEKREQRINEEKDRSNRRIVSQQEELESRIREETREKDLEIEVLQGNLRDLE